MPLLPGMSCQLHLQPTPAQTHLTQTLRPPGVCGLTRRRAAAETLKTCLIRKLSCGQLLYLWQCREVRGTLWRQRKSSSTPVAAAVAAVAAPAPALLVAPAPGPCVLGRWGGPGLHQPAQGVGQSCFINAVCMSKISMKALKCQALANQGRTLGEPKKRKVPSRLPLLPWSSTLIILPSSSADSIDQQ